MCGIFPWVFLLFVVVVLKACNTWRKMQVVFKSRCVMHDGVQWRRDVAPVAGAVLSAPNLFFLLLIYLSILDFCFWISSYSLSLSLSVSFFFVNSYFFFFFSFFFFSIFFLAMEFLNIVFTNWFIRIITGRERERERETWWSVCGIISLEALINQSLIGMDGPDIFALALPAGWRRKLHLQRDSRPPQSPNRSHWTIPDPIDHRQSNSKRKDGCRNQLDDELLIQPDGIIRV